MSTHDGGHSVFPGEIAETTCRVALPGRHFAERQRSQIWFVEKER